MEAKKLNLLAGQYVVNHQLTGTRHFDNWIKLCDFAIEVAEQEATKRMQKDFTELTFKIADEIIEHTQPYEP